jgi:hypothetical protein
MPHPGRVEPGPQSGFEQEAWTAYDLALSDVIRSRWYQLMKDREVPQDNGRVVMEFTLLPNGLIEDLEVTQNSEGVVFEAICQKAVLDPSPYRRWPAAFTAFFGDARRFRLTFEFDAWGTGCVGYEEEVSSALARHTPPRTTLIVLVYRRGQSPA